MLSLYEILKASKTGIAPDMWTALAGANFGGAGSGAETKEITGIPPLSIRSNGTMLLDYLISGNMTQTGTPTPTTPIQPSECGERTGNLWNEEGFSARGITSTHEHTDTNAYGTTLSTTIGKEVIITQSEYPTGTVGYRNGFFCFDVDFSKYEIGDIVTLSFDYICNEVHSIESQILTTLYAGKGNNTVPIVLSSGRWSVSGRLTAVITVIADMNPYVEVRLCGNSITVKNIMLNSGSTPLPYEPWGIKIPISSANTTTPVYLGEVETTRKIKKLVLTGQENWQRTTNGAYYIGTDVCPNDYLKTLDKTIVVCTHYVAQKSVTDSSNVNDNCISFFGGSGSTCELYIAARDVVDVETFKSYLQQQYAAGTPVTVWYVLSEPTTGIANEPLRKIGDHADTISYEQAGVQIPTNRGNTVIDVETTLKPSEMYIKYQE